MNAITTSNIFALDLSDDNLESLTIMGATVLVYVINFIQSQIPKVTDMVLSAFNVKAENQLSEKLADDAMQLTSATLKTVKSIGATIISGGEKKKDDK